MALTCGWRLRLDAPDWPHGPLYLVRRPIRMDQRQFPGFVAGAEEEAHVFRTHVAAERAKEKWRKYHPYARIVVFGVQCGA